MHWRGIRCGSKVALALLIGITACDANHAADVVDAADVPADSGVSIDVPAADGGFDAAPDVAHDVIAPLDVPMDGARSSGSCLFTPRALCQDLEGYTAIAPYMMACTTMGGTWSTDPCARTGAIGGCARDARDGSRSILWFYAADADVAAAESACVAAMGTWVLP